MKYKQKRDKIKIIEAILVDHNPDEINKLFPELVYAFEDKDGSTKAIICRLPEGKLKTVEDGVYLIKYFTSETLTICNKELFENTYEEVDGVEDGIIDEITDLYKNIDSYFIKRYYPEYSELTGPSFILGDQIAQGNLQVLLGFWRQYKFAYKEGE